MTQKILLYSLLAFSLFLLIDCKKKFKDGEVYKNPLTSYVVSKSSLNVYSTPDFTTKVIHSLPANSEFKILEHGIINIAFDKIRWYKIEQDKVIGYLSEQVLEKNEISSFEENSKPEEATVSATSLRVRKNPSLTGEVITSLPRNTKIEILANGIHYQQIDDKYDTWVKIKTKEGKVGFCFKGYLLFNLHPEWNEEAFPGFIEIKNLDFILVAPKGKSLREEFPYNNIFANTIYPVKTKATIDGKTFYSVRESYLLACDSGCTSGELKFWISSDDGEFFNTNLTDYTFQKYGFKNEGILNLIKSKVKMDIDVRKIHITPIGETSEGIAFYAVEIDMTSSYNDSSGNIYKIFEKNKEEYSEIYSQDLINKQSSWMGIELHDFDKDGISEVILSSNGRGSSYSVYYTIKNRQLISLLELAGGEMYGENPHTATTEIKDDKVIFTKQFSDQKKEVTTYQYEKGKFIKI